MVTWKKVSGNRLSWTKIGEPEPIPDPVDPVDPVDPTDPTDPTDPVDPVDPAPAPDTTPNPFHFAAIGLVDVGSVNTSAAILVQGINAASPIIPTDLSYNANGAEFLSTAGLVHNGDVVRARIIAPATYDTPFSGSLSIGGVVATLAGRTIVAPGYLINATDRLLLEDGSFLLTETGQPIRLVDLPLASALTGAETLMLVQSGFNLQTALSNITADTTPAPFSFMDVSNAAVSTVYTSNAVTITDIDTAAAVTITGGTYSKNGGGFTSAAGVVLSGDTLAVRATSSASNSTAVNVVLTVGGVADTYTITTIAASDTTPDPFVFTDVTGATLATDYESNTITVAGISAPTAITISGGQYSKNGGGYTSSAGTVVLGDTVKVKVTSSASNSTAVSATLTIGGVSDTYSVTTAAAVDTTPDAFTFTDVTGAALSSVYESNQITVAGINAAAAISITGGEYSKNGATYTSTSGTVVVGDSVKVRVTSSASNSTAVNAVLTIGGVSDTYTVSTTAAPPSDTTPDAFTFTAKTNALLSTSYESNAITVTGTDAPSIVSITGGEYQVNGGSWTSAGGSVSPSDSVKVRGTSSGSASTGSLVTLTIGGVAGTFSITTTVTWSTSDKIGTATISNGGLTVTKTGNASRGRATMGKSSGKVRWQTTVVVSSTGSVIGVGIVRNTYSLGGAAYVGSSTSGVGVFDDATYFNAAVTGAINNTVNCAGNGALIDQCADLDAGLFWARKIVSGVPGAWNANGSANPATGVGGIDISPGGAGPWHPVFAFDSTAGTGWQVDLNTGSSAFVGGAVSGFTAYGA